MPTRLRSIPPANRRPGSLARVAKFSKPVRSAAQGTESTSFKPRMIAPDPRIKESATQERIADLERLIREASDPEQAEFWQRLLRQIL